MVSVKERTKEWNSLSRRYAHKRYAALVGESVGVVGAMHYEEKRIW